MTDAEIVKAYLDASMIPDPETASTYVADGVEIIFTGGRKFVEPADVAAFNGKRYGWVKKKMERTDVVETSSMTIVYNSGTLYGTWPDGTEFEGNRYIDRFEVKEGKITKMEVWNDSAERLLVINGIVEEYR